VWDIVVEPRNLELPFDSQQPLSNRRVRFWPWPFGQLSAGIPLDDRAAQSPRGLRAGQQSFQEELRLLYVGLTRARDRVVLAGDSAQPQTWLEGLKASWLKPGESGLVLPDETHVLADHVKVVPPATLPVSTPEKQYVWFPAAKPNTAKLPAQLIPSHQPPLSKTVAKEIIELGSRMTLRGKCDEAQLGDALHAILAAEMIHPGHPNREAIATRILKGFDVQNIVDVRDALAMAERFQKRVSERFHPKSVLVEVPFEYVNAAGQRVAGFMDLLLETTAGWMVIDHKSFPGARKDWEKKALSYSGQLKLYRDGLIKNGQQCAGRWIHFAVGGGLVEISENS
jgi:ATP-dependent exoDNAse (exonuclease V) beta subunit